VRQASSVVRWRFREHGNEFEVAVDGHMVTNDGAVLVDAAVEGLGLAYVFDTMVGELVAQRRLVQVLEEYCPQIPGYFLYYPSRVNLAPKQRAFVEFLRNDESRPARPGSSSKRARRQP
jgi:DNA-binding transcriptional LysR family regulator